MMILWQTGGISTKQVSASSNKKVYY